MDSCDVLIVGGGPAGSACAWALRRSALDVLIVDRAHFPRDKVCAGWITPQVVDELELDLRDYSSGRTLQPITGFRLGCVGGAQRLISYGGAVSYGIRRCEFDDYLLRRSGARRREDFSVATIVSAAGGWIVNGEIRTRLLIGAGGHFCPVARFLSGPRSGGAVLAQEIEFAMDRVQALACAVEPEVPELFFCRDMRGYGWCVRKHDFLNIGMGRLDREALPQHVHDFAGFLRTSGRLGFDLPARLPGHAYLLYGYSQRPLYDDAVLLIGDAAGLAYPHSGEGIRTAVESGLLAAQVIDEANGHYHRQALAPYAARVRARFAAKSRVTAAAERIPAPLRTQLGRWLLRSERFGREVVLNDWFLHAGAAPLKVTVAEHRVHALAS